LQDFERLAVGRGPKTKIKRGSGREEGAKQAQKVWLPIESVRPIAPTKRSHVDWKVSGLSDQYETTKNLSFT
jgi:hypothetical protein